MYYYCLTESYSISLCFFSFVNLYFLISTKQHLTIKLSYHDKKGNIAFSLPNYCQQLLSVYTASKITQDKMAILLFIPSHFKISFYNRKQ